MAQSARPDRSHQSAEHLRAGPGCVRLGVGFGRGREAHLGEARLAEPAAQVAARVRLRAVAPCQVELDGEGLAHSFALG